MITSLLAVNTRHQINTDRLYLLSARLEELFEQIWACGQQPLLLELADEVAATAGEVILDLADLGQAEMVRGAIEDARRLREAARTLSPNPARLIEGGAVLTRDVALIIRADKQAA